MTIKLTRSVYVMAADTMPISFRHDVAAQIKTHTGILAGRISIDTAPTPDDAVAALVGGGWQQVPIHTHTIQYIIADKPMQGQIQRAMREHGGMAKDADPYEIVIPHGYTILQREIDGTIQYALVPLSGHAHVR